MIDIEGRTAYRLNLVRSILGDQTEDGYFAVLAGAGANSKAMMLRHLNLPPRRFLTIERESVRQ